MIEPTGSYQYLSNRILWDDKVPTSAKVLLSLDPTCDKVNDLFKRFPDREPEELLKDVVILEERGYIKFSKSKDIWKEIRQMQNRIDNLQNDTERIRKYD